MRTGKRKEGNERERCGITRSMGNIEEFILKKEKGEMEMKWKNWEKKMREGFNMILKKINLKIKRESGKKKWRR